MVKIHVLVVKADVDLGWSKQKGFFENKNNSI